MPRTIYLLGDSHVNMLDSEKAGHFDGDFFFKFVMGASFTAYSLGTHEEEILAALSKVDNSNWIIMIYGEIDCRYRIFYHHEVDGIPIDETVENTVCNYFKFIQCLQSLGYKICVSSIMPTMRVGCPWAGDPLQTLEHGHGGPDEDRRYITEIFNAKLKHSCWELEIPYLNLYPHLVDPIDGLTRLDMAYSERDPMHYGYIGDIATKVIKETLGDVLCK